jgi:hypothetical protein
MRFIIFLFVVLSTTQVIFSQVRVSGYYRKNGTYVEPHYRSSPNGNPYDNYSFPGNTNPYTGKVSTGDPDSYLINYYNKKTTSTTSPSVTNGLQQTYSTYNLSKSSDSYLNTKYKKGEVEKIDLLLNEFKSLRKSKE